MAKVKCEVCGRGMLTTGSNTIYHNGMWMHKSCPKVKHMDDAEKVHWDALRDRIDKLCVQYDKPANWKLITSQIKRYKEMGYSYEEQLYTLNYVVMKDGSFWGYGRIEKFFSHAMAYKQKVEILEKQCKEPQTKPIQLKSKSDFKIDI